MTAITPAQLKRVQTLWGKYASRTVLAGDSRTERLSWASVELGRTITSFSKVSRAEARLLIKALHGALGIPEEKQSRSRSRMRDRRDAEAAAFDGRRDSDSKQTTLVQQADIDRIRESVTRLGWSQERFDAWLRSTSSPLARKINGARVAPSNPEIRTVADANRVWWGLKPMLKRAGLWRD
jgi:ribosome-binding protein aMBF1 (putative translation factor)